MAVHDFCRASLKLTMPAVRRHTTPAQRKLAWVWRDSSGWFEFHGPDNDYYYTGSACCLYEARAKGWGAWLEKHFPEDVD